MDITALIDAVTSYGVPASVEHTGGGNFVVGLGRQYGYDEEQGTTRYDVNLGPVYREADGRFTAERGDTYAVSISPTRADVVIRTEAALLPTVLSMLGIDDVNVNDPTISLDDIAAALGAPWYVACLGGNIYGVARDDGTMITLDDGAVAFLPASVTVGRQGPDDDEWCELWSGRIDDVSELIDIVTDRA